MDKNQAKEMDNALVGPRLWCGWCGERKVLSLCYSCQCSKDDISIVYCRGCGLLKDSECYQEHAICELSFKKRFLVKINKMLAKKSLDLNLDKCGLKDLPQEIKQLIHLQRLRIRYNKLEELPSEIGQLTNLQRLYVSYNKLKKLPPEIGQLTNLQRLHIRSNELKMLPAEIRQLVNLWYLDLHENQIKELPIEISQLINLQYLELSNNPLNKNQLQKLRKALPNCKIITNSE